MTSGNYFFDDGKSRKFWSYTVRGKMQTVRHGRIGTAGRESSKTFTSPSAAREATTKLINQKLAKAYVCIDPAILKITKKKGIRSATKAQVAKLEKLLGAKLPTQYKDFLQSQNGGTPEPDTILIHGNVRSNHNDIGYIYGLSPKLGAYEGLSNAVENDLPRFPKGHLPIASSFDIYYYTISLNRNPGTIYFWDHEGPEREHEDDDFKTSDAILAAGSFNEFLTRINLVTPDDIEQEEINEQKKEDAQAAKFLKDNPPPKEKLPKKRQKEILRLVYQGGDDLTIAIEAGDAAYRKHIRKINRETKNFFDLCDDRYELEFFAKNWYWDGNVKPILMLIKNPYVDAGTLLKMYWYACPEDYYLFHYSASELDTEYERDVYNIIRRIERRIVKGEFKTASIAVDPTSFISMPERHHEFLRPIPDIMKQPIAGRKRKK
jgi:predicted DNA-binding WGR domain protein